MARLMKKGDKGGKEEKGPPKQPKSGRLDDDTQTARVTLNGQCLRGDADIDKDNYTIVSKTNGKDDTIMYPKNTGDCGPLTILCLDSLNRVVDNSEVILQPGHSIRRYDSARNTHSIVFYCKKDKGTGACKLEFDR